MSQSYPKNTTAFLKSGGAVAMDSTRQAIHLGWLTVVREAQTVCTVAVFMIHVRYLQVVITDFLRPYTPRRESEDGWESWIKLKSE